MFKVNVHWSKLITKCLKESINLCLSMHYAEESLNSFPNCF